MDLSFVTARYFRGWRPREINYGWCFVWAWLAHQEVGGELYTASYRTKRGYWMRSHAFIKINGFFYDAEAPHGVESPQDLPYSRRAREYRCVARRNLPITFRRYWGICSNLFTDAGVHPWHKIKKEV